MSNKIALIGTLALSLNFMAAVGFADDGGWRCASDNGNAGRHCDHDYRDLIRNPDGSDTIIEPRFQDDLGNPGPIAWENSVNDGVCKLYGYGGVATALNNEFAPNRNLAVINADGKLSQYMNPQHVFNLIICRSNRAPSPSTQAESIVQNDDGSTLIVHPRFDYVGGMPMNIAWNNSVNLGVCRLFGYSQVITAEPENYTPNANLAVIGEDGKISSLMNPQQIYRSIVCR